MNAREKVEEAIREILCRECDEQIEGSCDYKKGETKYCEFDDAIFDILDLKYINGNPVLGILDEEQRKPNGIIGATMWKLGWRKLAQEEK